MCIEEDLPKGAKVRITAMEGNPRGTVERVREHGRMGQRLYRVRWFSSQDIHRTVHPRDELELVP